VIPSFSPCFRSTMKVIFLNALEYCLWFPLNIRHCFKMQCLQFHFQFGKQSEITGGLAQRVGRMGNDNCVGVSHKLCGFQGRVGRCVVMMQEPIVVAPKFWFFVTHFLSSISKCHSKSQSWL
jgi:hypothetical protein